MPESRDPATSAEPALHVVGANPALDRLQVVPTFAPFGVNRARQVISRAGGKSLIVARAIRRLGGAVTLHGFLGGPVAEVIAGECRSEGIRDLHVRVQGETRTTVVIIEEATGLTTVVNEPGPVITSAESQQMEATLFSELRAGDLLVLTGSLPPGIPTDFYARVITRARAAGSVVLVDTSGEPLAQAITAGPDVVKVNAQEFQHLLPAPDSVDGENLLRAMDFIRQQHRIGTVIVTQGSKGCVAMDATHIYDVSAPVVDTVNATGSGDAFFGALALTLARQAARGASSLAEALRIGTGAGAANAVQLSPEVGSLTDVLRYAQDVDVRVTQAGSGAVPTPRAGTQ
ncbi:1-phosphofructokinase family hexose kinase [Planosporangium thailandense]|uniref:1-phosphofructokinase family hexose kinase n=1 Tax=Planosporangium thailandense TaxID=765197 RepID=A0ABX0XVJ7_9ACTN|nr:1-phosphofructokinase family hexose kinase [Planosporangium thailandense]NJC69233.1 1-phosphofructokinase family hexose kinase [Planosporangium thailandense]